MNAVFHIHGEMEVEGGEVEEEGKKKRQTRKSAHRVTENQVEPSGKRHFP